MRKIKTETLIIGAGPAGLACAAELSKAHKNFIVIEKQSCVGGLSKTYTFEEEGLVFRTDNGPHRFFSKNNYLYEFIEDLLQDKWIVVTRQTRQYIKGKFYDYPINIGQALRNIGFGTSIRMIVDYFKARVVYDVFRKRIISFQDYVYAHFGKSLGEFNIINYTEKIWGVSAQHIHTDWAVQRIKGLSIRSILVEAFSAKKEANHNDKKSRSLVDAFFYPQYGTGLIYETIAEKLTKSGYEILLKTEPKEIIVKGNRIKKVIITTGAEEVEVECNSVVESVPVPSFIKLIKPTVPFEISKAARSLKYRSQVYVFITLNKESITKDQWIYFPDIDIPIARISEMKNFSPIMSPEGKTSLFVEYFCTEDDEVWMATDKEMYERTLACCESMNFFTQKEVRKYYVFRQKDVYPLYDLDYKTHVEKIKNYLNKYDNLYYIGRPGRFRYNNQDHSLEMGIMAARSIIDGVKYDIETIGSEQEYFEKGVIPKE